MSTSDKAHKLLSLAEQWERDAAGCRRDGYIDAAVVKEECAQRIRQTLGISAIAEVFAARRGAQADEVEHRARKLLEAECGKPLPIDIPVCAAISVVKAALSQPEARAPVEVDAPGSHAWMAEVCRAAALSLAAHGVWNDQLSKVADWIDQQPSAEPRSTHRAWRRNDWRLSYFEALSDHHIGCEQQPAAVECDCPAGRIDHASWCAVSKAQDAAIAAQHQEPKS